MKRPIVNTREAHEALVEAAEMRIGARDRADYGAVLDRREADAAERAALDFLTLRQPVETGTGGEMVPQRDDDAKHPGIATMVRHPDLTAAHASRDRIVLADEAGVFDLAVDAAESAGAQGSLEKMLTHQMAACHGAAMKMFAQMQTEMRDADRWQAGSPARARANADAVKLGNAAVRLIEAYQRGMLTLARTRSGGRQTVHVTHQHVHVTGGQVAVAGTVESRGGLSGAAMKNDDQPHATGWARALERAGAAPRCGARRKRDGRPCAAPAMPNGRCRMHGGASLGAPTGAANGNFRRSVFTREAVEKRRQARRMLRRMDELIDVLKAGCRG